MRRRGRSARRPPRGEPPATVAATAAAKVNLGLWVGDLRPDGFHDVAGLVQTVSLSDTLRVEAADDPNGHAAVEVDGARVALIVQGPEADPSLASPDNLVLRAARLLAGSAKTRPVAITLDKHIPVAAGVGGGSADAAAALVALAAVWGARASAAKLRVLAATLGSDVPAILTGGLVAVSGRGEDVRAVGSATGTAFVLGVSHGGLSTPAVYAELDRLRAAGAPTREPGFSNDLQAAALSLDPSLGEALAAMRSAGTPVAFVSGSGPTVVGVFGGLEAASTAARRLGDAFRRTVVCEAVASGVTLRIRPR